MKLGKAVVCALFVNLVAQAGAQANITPFENLGGGLNPASNLSVTKRVDGPVEKVNVYGIDFNQHVKMWEIFTGTGTVGGPTDLGCCLTSSVSAIAWPNYRAVFAIGTNGRLYYNQSINNDLFAGWDLLVHPQDLAWCGKPAAVTNAVGKISVFLSSCADGHAWYISWTGSAWVWRDMNKTVRGDMAVASGGSDNIDVWAIDPNGDLWQDHYVNGGFTWSKSNLHMVTAPAVPLGNGGPGATAFVKSTFTDTIWETNHQTYFTQNDSNEPGGPPVVAYFGQFSEWYVYHLDVDSRFTRVSFKLGIGPRTGFVAIDNSIWHSEQEFLGNPAVMVAKRPNGAMGLHVFGIATSGDLLHTIDDL